MRSRQSMRIVIPGEPIPKARHRSFIRHGKMATYDEQHLEKIHTRILMNRFTENHELKHCAHIAKFEFHFEPPKSASVATKNMMLWGCIHHIKKPDTSNLMKFYEDCGNGILWPDDCLLIDEHPIKRYSQNPCTIITVTPINEVKMSDDHEKVFKTFSPTDCETMSADAERIYMSIPVYHLDNPEIYKSQMAAAAELLIDFADEWADKLKKIKRKANQ